jgi:hypothetical protein
MQRLNNVFYIGVSGFARSGKDLYCDIASNILSMNGYVCKKFSFANCLKSDLEPWILDKYGISVWTNNEDEKLLIRPFFVAHGCGKRDQTNGVYWVDKVNENINDFVKGCDGQSKYVVFISDVRFENETHFIHSKNGFVVHVSKFTKTSLDAGRTWDRKFILPPNATEEKNDPLVQKLADFKLQWEDLSFAGGVKININELVNNMYLREKVTESLQACPNLLPPLTTQVKT